MDSKNNPHTEKAEQEYLTTQEVATYLNRSLASVYKYIKEEKLNPIYDHKWRMRKTKLFKKSDVDHFKDAIKKPGITTFEASKRADISYATLMWFIYEEILPAKKIEHRGKEQYFITEEDFNDFISSKHIKNYKEKKEKNHFATQSNYLLFQSFVHPESKELARIMEIFQDNEKVVTQSGSTLTLDELLSQGFLERYSIPEMDFINRKGYATFQFLKPYDIQSTIYSIIEKVYLQVGPKNVKMKVDHDYIYVDIKPTFVNNVNKEEVRQLRQFIRDGKIIDEVNGVFIDTDLEPLNIHVPSKLKALIRDKAAEEDTTIEEVTIKALHAYWNLED
ncbi:helix-turn-helix domain-containing protein [Rossellomorea sp. NPDC071047]|uniref:helix-turn-helix domain-containing protein n=1 Tax=Rossellomorea sp. NPDC071047 TaxID=3390675 RepID=UPI003D05523F